MNYTRTQNMPTGARFDIKWFARPITFLVIICPVLIVFTVPSEQAGAAFLAYLNCVLLVASTVYMLKRDLYLGLIIVFALPSLLLAWSGSSLYFAITGIDATYNLYKHGTSTHFLEGFVRVQLAMFLFLCSFLPIILFFFKNFQRIPTNKFVQNPKRLVKFISLICIGIMSLFVANYFQRGFSGTGLSGGPTSISWWAFGLNKYCIGLMLIVGAYARYLPRFLKIFLPVFLVSYSAPLLLAGTRMFALRPLIFFLAGLLFMTHLRNRSKISLFLLGGGVFIILVLAGAAVRTDGQGWAPDRAMQRVVLMFSKETYTSLHDPLTTSMSRFFMTGGHAIITKSPEKVPYLEFHPLKYTGEMIGSLLPGFIYYRPFYKGNSHLLRYDLNVVTSSIEISHLGHYWMLGGPVAVFAGGITTGLLTAFVLWLLARARQVSQVKGLIYLSIFSMAFFGFFGFSFISLFSKIFWFWAMAAILWFLLSRFVGDPENSRMPDLGT